MTVESIKTMLRDVLSEKRYRHSLAVAEMAKTLALLHGANPERAYLAGLVHDCMREYPKDRVYQYCGEHGITFTPLEAQAPNLWHAILGAAAIQEQYCIFDSDIIHAVRYHTTGRAHMSLLERVVYVADCTSADRDYPDVGEVRETAKRCLNDGVRASLLFCVSELRRKGMPVHPDTLDAADEYCR